MTLSIMTLSIITLSIMTLSIMTVSIKTLSIIIKNGTLTIMASDANVVSRFRLLC
jgi:hypothetical protein